MFLIHLAVEYMHNHCLFPSPTVKPLCTTDCALTLTYRIREHFIIHALSVLSLPSDTVNKDTSLGGIEMTTFDIRGIKSSYFLSLLLAVDPTM